MDMKLILGYLTHVDWLAFYWYMNIFFLISEKWPKVALNSWYLRFQMRKPVLCNHANYMYYAHMYLFVDVALEAYMHMLWIACMDIGDCGYHDNLPSQEKPLAHPRIGDFIAFLLTSYSWPSLLSCIPMSSQQHLFHSSKVVESSSWDMW